MSTFPESLNRSRFGVMRCCWSKTTFAEHCGLSSALGAAYVEDFAFQLEPERVAPSTAKDALTAAKIPLLLVIAHNLDCTQPDATCQHLARQIERWQDIGLTTFVTLRAARGPSMDDFLRTLQAAASVVRRAGLTPLSQNHRGGVIESAEELLRCREAGVELHFDTQQFPVAGHDALASWDRVGPHVRHVHLGDRDTQLKGCAFGEGTVRLRELLQRMHATGYRGAMTVETEYGPGDVTGSPVVKQAIDFCHAVLAPLDATGVDVAPGHAQVAASAVPVTEAPWGTLHWVSNGEVFGGCQQTLGFVTVKVGWDNGLHRHPIDQEILYVVRGRCRHRCGEQDVVLERGDVLFIPAGQVHGATNIGDEPLELIVNYPTGHRSFESVRKAEPVQ
jgi:quercetin dioxygenase-like cupin family protein/sugar phosphate isomerase/epimerase